MLAEAETTCVVYGMPRSVVEAGLADEAREALRAALFRNPRDARFRKLWNEFQFQRLHEIQQAAGGAGRGGEGQGPVLLPFCRAASAAAADGMGEKIIRHDGPAPLPLPHRPRRVWRPDQTNAQ